MRIASWNVNSVRTRLDQVLTWLKQAQPDVLCLQETKVADELFPHAAFDELGYRRYEWKCDSLNAPSRAAALRLGFTFEGHFRQATIYKNRNRDTDWLSILDSEWPAIRQGFEAWLAESNFDAGGSQRAALADLIKAKRKAA